MDSARKVSSIKTSSLTSAALKYRLPLAFMLLVTGLVAGGLAWHSGTAHGTSSNRAKSSDQIRWKACGQSGTQCGQVSVPLDWNKPDGPHIKLAVAILHASDPSQRVGTLFFNPGGPGGSGVDPVENDPAQTFPAQLLQRYDIVGFDPRGVGQSEPAVNCTVPSYNSNISLFPQTRAQYDQLVAHNRAVGESCLAGTGNALRYIDTVSVARDIDAIRAALGVQQISWLGLSYGTMLGAQYAQLFPSHVAKLALDGELDHGLSMDLMLTTAAAATENEFQRFVAWCDANTSCALHGQPVTAGWQRLIAQTQQHPIPVTNGQAVTAQDIIAITQEALQVLPEKGPLFSQLLAAVEQGDASIFAQGVLNDLTTPSFDVYRSILCLDFSPQLQGGYAGYQARMQQVRALSPLMGGYSEIWLAMAGCVGWPIQPVDPQNDWHVTGIPAALVVTNVFDNSTPFVWGQDMQRRITNSHLLVNQIDGHTAFNRSACATQVIVTYLVQGTLPSQGVTCSN